MGSDYARRYCHQCGTMEYLGKFTVPGQARRYAALLAAVRDHHAQRADDRCWLDDAKVYAAAGLPPGDPRVGDKAAMLANCERFVRLRCEAGGPWETYAALEAEVAALREALKNLMSIQDASEDCRCADGVVPCEACAARAALALDAAKEKA